MQGEGRFTRAALLANDSDNFHIDGISANYFACNIIYQLCGKLICRIAVFFTN
jgi:hypothetical protein